MPKTNRLLTGIRASGEIHLGNYLGAMKPAVEAQHQYESYLFIADLHALTSTPSSDQLRQNVRAVAAAWLAAGIDTSQTVLWRQSDVPEVLELSYILSCVTNMGLLERAHSYKDAKEKGGTIKTGLFFYPVLMAADILLYDADRVPVGKDQLQHLEMTRDIATFFNETYGSAFKLPKEQISSHSSYIPGIDGRKMSKSYHNGISLFAEKEELKKEVMRIKTDSKSLAEPKDPNGCIVYQIFRLIASNDRSEEMAKKLRGGNYGYGEAKKELLNELLSQFDSMRQNYQYWQKNPDQLEAELQKGAELARTKAKKKISRIKEMVGL